LSRPLGGYQHPTKDIEINAGRPVTELRVENLGDRPIQVGSHFHFGEVNRQLRFDRAAAYGLRLDIPAGTAVRFEPGQLKTVRLVPIGGRRVIHGFSALVAGPLDAAGARDAFRRSIAEKGFEDSGPQ
jgi:urease beta subunit